MNVLVTGASGFVGRHLTGELINNGHNVSALVRPKDEYMDGLDVLAVDLNDEQAVCDTVKFYNIDAVIHLAGHAAVGASFEKASLYEKENPGMQDNLVKACIKQNAKPKLLIVSSGSVYDKEAQLPLTENSPVLASSPYAQSKILQESRVNYYRELGLNCEIARPFNHTGPGQKTGFICADFANDLVNIETGLTDCIKVGNLDAKRDYTDVRDIARAYRLIIEQEPKNTTYNICSETSLSGRELLGMFVCRSLAEIAVIEDPLRMRPSDSPEIVGSYKKLQKATKSYWVATTNTYK